MQSPKMSDKGEVKEKAKVDLNSLAEQSESIKRLWVQMARATVDRDVHPDPEKV